MSTMKRRGIPSLGAAMTMAALAALGCSGGDEAAPIDGPPTGQGSLTSLVAIINPVVNLGHAKHIPFEMGSERDGIPIDASPGSASTFHEGIAKVYTGTGFIELRIGNARIGYSVPMAGDAHDAIFGYNGSSVSFYQNGLVRHPVGEAAGAVSFGPTDALATIQAELAKADRVVVLRAGIYKGDLTIDGVAAMLCGEDFADNAVVIDGSVTVSGSRVRLRGLTITGDLVAKARDFGMNLSKVEGSTTITGDAPQLVRNVFCSVAELQTSNATLLDNFGLAPAAAPAGACD
jgi:hypothetical protein